MASSQDTEITLGTAKLLGLFFGLVAICAVFFALGYTLGRKSDSGLSGAGNVTKLANQVIVASNIAAMSEALVLATKPGVAPELVYQAIRGGLAGSKPFWMQSSAGDGRESSVPGSESIFTSRICRTCWTPHMNWGSPCR